MGSDASGHTSQVVRLHATCVACGHNGILLLGEPGTGKSDLALRLIDRGGELVVDDQVELRRTSDGNIEAAAPERIFGLLEVRGVGIFQIPARKSANVLLVVHLVKPEWIERLPYPEPYECLGVRIPQLRLTAFEPSAPLKIEWAATALEDGSMTVGALRE